jgi:hypothetical protein
MKRNPINSHYRRDGSLTSVNKSVFKSIFIDEHQMLSVNIYDNRNYLIKDIETEVKKIGFKTPSHQNWKFAAAVVDKFCMILFFVINTLFTVFMIFLQIYFNQASN